nr:ribonuclease H-like domain-containing protein [Tanacetum cinerariifolium]
MGGNNLHWQWELILPVGTLTWQWECLVHFIPNKYKCINDPQKGNPQHALQDKGVIDSGCSRHMIGKMSYLSDFEVLNGGYVAFGGNPKGGKISGKKSKIKTEKLDFDDVYFVKELKFNLFSVLQMCDKKNSILFTDTECLVLSPDFKLPDKTQVLLRVPRENNMYNVDLKHIVPFGDLTFLFAKATLDESNLWHRRLGHINFKTMNKLVKGKFDGKVDEGFLVGYSICSKAFRVFNSRTHIVQETLHINFLENKPNVAGVQEQFDAEKAGEENVQQYVLFLVWSSGSTNPQNTDRDAAFDKKEPEFEGRKPKYEVNVSPSKFEDFSDSNINKDNAVGSLVPVVRQIFTNKTNTFSAAGPFNVVVNPTHRKSSYVDSSQLPDVPNMPELEDIAYSDDEDDVGVDADFNNLKTSITVSPIPTTRVHKDHHMTQIISDLSSATQTRSMTRVAKDQGGATLIQDVEGLVRNKARLVAQGHTQEEGIYYEEVFALVARIEAIRLFLAYASFMGFMVYQMDVKSVFLYETIEEEVYVCQPLGFEDPDHLDKVYKVVKALYGSSSS